MLELYRQTPNSFYTVGRHIARKHVIRLRERFNHHAFAAPLWVKPVIHKASDIISLVQPKPDELRVIKTKRKYTRKAKETMPAKETKVSKSDIMERTKAANRASTANYKRDEHFGKPAQAAEKEITKRQRVSAKIIGLIETNVSKLGQLIYENKLTVERVNQAIDEMDSKWVRNQTKFMRKSARLPERRVSIIRFVEAALNSAIIQKSGAAERIKKHSQGQKEYNKRTQKGALDRAFGKRKTKRDKANAIFMNHVDQMLRADPTLTLEEAKELASTTTK